jgi:cytochrome c oxidase assembly protein subunit 15
VVSTTLAVVHGCFGQLFFCLLTAIAVLHTRAWRESASIADPARLGRLRRLAWGFLAVAFLQLAIGAVMRHFKAGLAIPDFPLAFGKLVPPVHSFAIDIHYAHRIWAIVVIAAAAHLAFHVARHFRTVRPLFGGSAVLAALVLVQVALGASVIWTHRATVPTCFHVVNGALVLGAAVFVALHAHAVRPHGPLLATQPAGGAVA